MSIAEKEPTATAHGRVRHVQKAFSGLNASSAGCKQCELVPMDCEPAAVDCKLARNQCKPRLPSLATNLS